MFFVALLSLLSVASAQEYTYGYCAVTPDPSQIVEEVQGTVDFRYKNGGPLEIKLNLNGFDPDDENEYHGFHVHTYGDISNGCSSTGGHFNPANVNHGSPNDASRHVGDFGNIRESATGEVVTSLQDSMATLSGQASIIGRGVVIHAKVDDLGQGGNNGSLISGNAGVRLACCAIALSDGSRWN